MTTKTRTGNLDGHGSRHAAHAGQSGCQSFGPPRASRRAAEEVRAAEFGHLDGELEPEAVAIADMIIKRKAGSFDPSTCRDRYQDALRELIEAKIKGLPIKARPETPPAPVFDLMAAL